jgi:hypothetical protein
MPSTDPRLSEVLDAIAEERVAWSDLVAAVGSGRMLEPGPMGEWTFKDLAAHLAGWRERGIARLEAAGRGAPEPPPPWPANLTDDDEINDWIQGRSRDRSVDDILAETDASYLRLSQAVQALPTGALWDPAYFPWTEGTAVGQAIVDRSFFGHLHEEHEPDVRAWLQRTG